MQKLILNMATASCHLVQEQKVLRLRGIDIAFPNDDFQASTFSIRVTLLFHDVETLTLMLSDQTASENDAKMIVEKVNETK